MFRRTLSLLTVAGVAACAPAATSGTSAAVSRPTAPTRLEPTADELRTDLFAFAADSFRGRETGTPDADRAAAFIARRIQSLGLEPAGDSGYFQRVPMTRSRMTARTLTVTTPGGSQPLTLGRDLAIFVSLGAPVLPKLSASGDVVFAGFGLVDPSLGRDDYKGLDVVGKIVTIAGIAPPGVDSTRRAGLENIQAILGRIGMVIARRPAGIIMLLPDSLFRLALGELSGTQIELGAATAPPPRSLPMIAVAPLRPGSPLLPANWSTATGPQPVTGTAFTAQVELSREGFNGYNVAGIVRGSDPALRNTYVAYGAHYDHIGIQAPVNGDSIANGADDDGSGSVTLLAIARAWVQGPKPPRSALFVWHVGEEKGLFGSTQFTNHPTVPIDSIVAQLNADMIGRNGDDTLYIVGPGAAPNGQSRVLGGIIDSVNTALPRPFVFDREWDTTTHPERIYYRSDHYNYAQKGIPIVFFTTGLHPQYHQVTDEPGLINYPKMARVGALLYESGIAVARRPTRPKPLVVQ
jgi:Peptidase family M28